MCKRLCVGFITFFLTMSLSLTASAAIEAKASPASDKVIKANQAVLKELPFSNKQDFINSDKGLVGKPDSLVIKNKEGQVVWDMDTYNQFEQGDAPDTVNPSLWRQAQLNNIYGLFKVTDGVYQVRGYDLSVMSVIDGKTGYIVVDPLTSEETAKAAMDLVYEHLPKKPITAVIYTHSHVDHFAGVVGIVSREDVDSGKVRIIAPLNFMEEAVSENVLAGPAMGRRAMYMYGAILEKSVVGQVDAGLGKTNSTGRLSILPPTDIITEPKQEMTVDGVKMVFQYTPNTEAPAEMNFFMPEKKALCMAENATHTLHNLYTLRGAKVRDAKSWRSGLTDSIRYFGDDTEVIFASHHWPTWGNENVLAFLEKQRDMYAYIHDQTLRLINQGYTSIEIAEELTLPKSLADEWYNRGYYGSVSHDIKAVYDKYMGWFDGNPANLHPLPPVETSKKTVEYMGGEAAVLDKAKQDIADGNFRWAAQVLNNVVYANPENQAAKNMLAETYEQLGYMAENATWRNFYLVGAAELRGGVQTDIPFNNRDDFTIEIPVPLFLESMSVLLDGPAADGKEITFKWTFPDIDETWLIQIKNSVMHYRDVDIDVEVDATVTTDKAALNSILLGLTIPQAKKMDYEIGIEGDKSKVAEFFSLVKPANKWFNIVTP